MFLNLTQKIVDNQKPHPCGGYILQIGSLIINL